MVTDFSEYTSVGLRHITYNGIDSLSDLGILITTATQTSDITVRSVVETLPFKQGSDDLSRENGGLYYESRRLHYVFKVFADTEARLAEKRASVRDWLQSDGEYEIADSDENGYRFTKCVLKDLGGESIDVAGVYAEYITADFDCAPFKIAPGGVETMLAKVYDTSFRMVIIDNSVFSMPATLEGVQITQTDENDYQLKIPAPEGTVLAQFSTNLDIESAEGVTLRHYNGQYYAYGNANNGYLIFTVKTSGEVTGAAAEALVGSAVIYSADRKDRYQLTAYVAEKPVFTVNGNSSYMKNIELDDQPVNVLEVSGTVDGIYVFKYDSTEKRI